MEKIGLNLKIIEDQDEEEKDDKIIVNQTPKEGIKQEKDGYVVCNIN